MTKRPPSPKQKATAKVMVEAIQNGEVLTKKELVAKGSYSKAIQSQPHKVLETEGYKQALAEYGLTEELITCSLVEDIEKKPQNRVQELKLGSEILGMKRDTNVNVQVNIANLIGKYGE